MGYGYYEWGFDPWGDDSVVLPGATSFSLSNVEVLSKNTILLGFTDNLSKSAANFAVDNYTVSGLVVKQVLPPVSDEYPNALVLVTEPILVGNTYEVSAQNLEATDGSVVASTALSFTGRKTKLDKVLTGAPILYDTSPGSVVMQVLTAIHRENDKIGGTEDEE
jgi:hypothetical protein